MGFRAPQRATEYSSFRSHVAVCDGRPFSRVGHSTAAPLLGTFNPASPSREKSYKPLKLRRLHFLKISIDINHATAVFYPRKELRLRHSLVPLFLFPTTWPSRLKLSTKELCETSRRGKVAAVERKQGRPLFFSKCAF